MQVMKNPANKQNPPPRTPGSTTPNQKIRHDEQRRQFHEDPAQFVVDLGSPFFGSMPPKWSSDVLEGNKNDQSNQNPDAGGQLKGVRGHKGMNRAG